MQIKKIILETHLINELKSFYTDIPGLKLKPDSPETFTVTAGLSEIKFVRALKDKPFYHFAFNIPENQISEAREWVLSFADTIKLNGSDIFDFKSWDAHSVYFYDPAGNILELIARHRLKNSSDKKFSGESLLCISETGIPVNNVYEFKSRIESPEDLTFFSGDNESFAALGDDNGLLIIVKNGRKWYPDCPEAEIFPVEVEVNSNREGEFYSEENKCRIFFRNELK